MATPCGWLEEHLLPRQPARTPSEKQRSVQRRLAETVMKHIENEPIWMARRAIQTTAPWTRRPHDISTPFASIEPVSGALTATTGPRLQAKSPAERPQLLHPCAETTAAMCAAAQRSEDGKTMYAIEAGTDRPRPEWHTQRNKCSAAIPSEPGKGRKGWNTGTTRQPGDTAGHQHAWR